MFTEEDRLLLIKLAEKDDRDAQLVLGLRYLKGDGVEKSDKNAVHWLTKAAEQNHIKAQRVLADYHFDKGVKLLNEHPLPLREKDQRFEAFVAAAFWAKKAAEGGSVVCQYKLSEFFRYGVGVIENAEKKVEWCKRAAENGYRKAMIDMGEYCAAGEVPGQGEDEAADWFFKAAMKDSEESLKRLINLADTSDNVRAMTNIAEVYRSGPGRFINHSEALLWANIAELHGSARGTVIKAECYLFGKGIERNEEEAVRLFKSVADKEPRARSVLNLLERSS